MPTPELLGTVESCTHDTVSAKEMALSLAREAEGKCKLWRSLLFVFHVRNVHDPALIQGMASIAELSSHTLASIRGNTVHSTKMANYHHQTR